MSPASPTESPEAEIYGQDEAFGKIAVELLRTDKTKILSDIEEDEVRLLSVLLSVSDKIESDFIRSICKNFMQLRVSKNRAGRQEVMSIALASRFSGGSKGKTGVKDLFAGLG